MLLKNVSSLYNLCLSLSAFYLGSLMILGEGVFATFPPEWIGKMPFDSWLNLSLFGMIIFGIGNAIAAIYGFIKRDKRIFIIMLALGILLFLSSLSPVFLLGEMYLPAAMIWLSSLIQLLLAISGLIDEKSKSA
ncbi:hypothetical protein [Aquisalibacillus elongatus]|uniref:Uncharacterized protein n=1 Tax=Aquisalibacillus elongatus TaxID=485577 RepID=A0A3N5BLU7_9BACI|nr:hypothetical protein [Aquisalibacillus elongatus]RPF56150.1 hypothetical protein EDC24_1039 [Aquisalibacillus elongatus]